jgi:hypothetical protein
MGYVKIPGNYPLSFDIKPAGVLSEKSSIIHFWNLSIRFSGIGYTGAGFNNIRIPADRTSHIQVNAFGLQVEVLLNFQFYELNLSLVKELTLYSCLLQSCYSCKTIPRLIKTSLYL